MAKAEGKTTRQFSPNIDQLDEELRSYIIRQEKRIQQLEDLLANTKVEQSGLSTNKQLLHIFDQLNHGVLEEDSRGVITNANPNFWRIFRLSIPPEEIIGTPIEYLLLELKNLFRNPTYFEKSIREIIQNKELVISQAFELNTGRIIEVEYLPNYRANTYLGQIFVFKDVTQIRQSNVQIAQLKAQLESILNASTSGIIAFKSIRNTDAEIIDFEVIASNKAAENKLGRKLVLQMLGKILIDSLSQDSENNLFELYKRVVETGKTLDHEYSIQTKNETVWVHSVAVKLDDGFVVTFSDITTAKEATQRFREQSNVLSGITDNMPVVIYKLDSQGNYKEIFGSGLKAFRLKDNDLVGQSVYQKQPHFKPYIDRALLGERVTFVNQGQTAREEWFFEHHLFKDPYSEGIIGFALDITESSIAERDLKEAKKIAEDSVKAKEIFLANMSHEIRTPMNGILGMAQLLFKTPLEEKQSNYLNIIRKSAENLLVILNDILDLAKIESGKLEIEHIPFDLREVVETAIQSFIYKADEKAIGLSFNLGSLRERYLIGDPFRLNQVLVNLLSNAIKFTDRGEVKLEVKALSNEENHISYEFCISDTGIGIDQEKISHLFEQFTQADSGIGRKYGGTGLGLNISKNLIEMQGGRIWAESSPGLGSRFYFTLKFEKDKNATDQIPAAEINNAKEVMKGLRVLLAEDNEVNQFYARTVLESWACEVEVAANGQDAVHLFSLKTFDMVLMDIQMPKMNGIEATMSIRNHSDPRKARVPVIALTANALKGDHDQYLAHGMNDSVTKPFDEDTLFKVMIKALGKSQVGEQRYESRSEGRDGALYDLSQLEMVSRGNPDFMRKMLSIFIETSLESIAQMEDALALGNWSVLKEVAHKFKSSIDTLNIESIRSTIRQIEGLQADQATQASVAPWMQQLKEVILKSHEQLRSHYPELG